MARFLDLGTEVGCGDNVLRELGDEGGEGGWRGGHCFISYLLSSESREFALVRLN